MFSSFTADFLVRQSKSDGGIIKNQFCHSLKLYALFFRLRTFDERLRNHGANIQRMLFITMENILYFFIFFCFFGFGNFIVFYFVIIQW
jgi:hypothetical protein